MIELGFKDDNWHLIAPNLDSKSAIYAFVSDDEILYIGQTTRLNVRIRRHRAWLHELCSKSRIYICFRYCNSNKLDYFERKLIKRYQPLFNRNKYDFSNPSDIWKQNAPNDEPVNLTSIAISCSDDQLKKDFKRWCLENNTTMSAEFIKFMEERTRKKNKKEVEKK